MGLNSLIRLVWNNYVTALFISSSIFFVFISGYLTILVEDRKHSSASAFYFRKIKNVVLPYIVVSVLIVVCDYIFLGKTIDLTLIPYKLITGSASPHLWFIPMICCCFITSPLLLKLKNKHLTFLTFISFLFPVFGAHQGFFYPVKSAVLSFLYFSPFFYLESGITRTNNLLKITLGRISSLL